MCIPDSGPKLFGRGFRRKLSASQIPVNHDWWEIHPPAFPCRDQGDEGSCTGHGFARGVLIMRSILGLPVINPSPRYAYWWDRFEGGGFEGTQHDDGSQICDVIKAGIAHGICDESLFPYRAGEYAVGPDAEVCTQAESMELMDFQRVDPSDINNVLEASMAGPIVFGIPLFQSFVDARYGDVPMPDPDREKYIGSHCMCVSAFWQGNQRLGADNSWGILDGRNGRRTIPFEYFTHREFGASDCWLLRRMS